MDLSLIEQNYKQIDDLCAEAVRIANAYDVNTETKNQLNELIDILEKTYHDLNNITTQEHSVQLGFKLPALNNLIQHIKEISDFKITAKRVKNTEIDSVLNSLQNAITGFSVNTNTTALVASCNNSIQKIKNATIQAQNAESDINQAIIDIERFIADNEVSYGDLSQNIASILSESVNSASRRLMRINKEIANEALWDVNIPAARTATNTSKNVSDLIKQLNKIADKDKVDSVEIIDNINAEMVQALRTAQIIAERPVSSVEDAMTAYKRIYQVKDIHDKLSLQRERTAELSQEPDISLQSKTLEEISASINIIHDALADNLENENSKLKESFKRDNLRSNEDLTVSIAKMFASNVSPLSAKDQFNSFRNAREILYENKTRNILGSVKNNLVSRQYLQTEEETLRHSIISEPINHKQQEQLKNVSSQTHASAHIGMMASSTISDGTQALNRSTTVFDNLYKNMTPREKENYDRIQKELLAQIRNTVNLINALEMVDPESKYLDQLKNLNAALVDREKAMSEAKKEETKESLRDKIMAQVSGFWGFVGAGLSIMGLGGFLSLSKALSDVKNLDVETGKLLQQSAKTDIALGADIHAGDNYDRIFKTGMQIQHLSAGMISYAAPTQFYQSLARQIGGKYNSNPNQNREDLAQLADNLFLTKEINGLDNNDFNQLIKYYFKDSGQDVGEVTSKIMSTVAQAKSLNVPVKAYISQVSSLATKSYTLGMDADKATNLMYSLVKRGMIVEDAHNLVIKSAQVAQRFGQNKSQVAYFGALSGMGINLYDNMVEGRIFMDRFGKPVDGYREKMGKALLKKYTMYDDMLSVGDQNLRLAQFGRLLKEDGFSEKEVGQMMALKQEGRTDEIEEILVGNVDKKFKKREELSNELSEVSKALGAMGAQTAETQKMAADRQQAILRLVDLWKQNIAPLIAKVMETISDILQKLPKVVMNFIGFIKEIMNDPNAAGFVKSFGDNPLLTIFGGLTALTTGFMAGKWAIGKGASWAGNKILNGVNKIFKTNINSRAAAPSTTRGMNSKFGKYAALATLTATLAPTIYDFVTGNKKEEPQLEELLDESEESQFIAFMKSGKAKITITNFDGSVMELEDDEDEQNFLDTTFKISFGVASLLAIKKGYSMFMSNANFKHLDPRRIYRNKSTKDIRRINRSKSLIRGNLSNAWNRLQLRNIFANPRNLGIKKSLQHLAKVPTSMLRTFNEMLNVSGMPKTYKEQFKKHFGTEKPKITSVKDAFKLGKSFGGGVTSTIWEEAKKFRAANSSVSGIWNVTKSIGKDFWGTTLFFTTVEEVSDYASGNQRSLGERAARVGIGFGSSLGGAALGAAVGQALIPIPVVGAAIGGIAGGYLGSKIGDWGKDKLGIGEKMDEATRNWMSTMNETSKIRGVNVLKVIESKTQQGEILRQYLKQNGLDLTDLNDTQKEILKLIVEQNKRQNATMGQFLTDLALRKNQILTEHGFGKGNLGKYLNDNTTLAKFYEDYAKNYKDDELNTLYTHLSNYYYHPNAGSDDKEYWENETYAMRALSKKDTEFAKRIKRNYIDILKEDGRYEALKRAALANKTKTGITSSYMDDVDLDEFDISDEEIADEALKTISVHDTVKLWQHIAAVIKEQPEVYSDLQNYIIEKYGQPQSGGTVSGDIPMWLQGDERWASMSHGYGTMGPSGCFATSAAMMRAIYTGEMIDPGQFLQKGLWSGGAGAEWYQKLQMRQEDPASYEEAVALVRKYLQSGRAIMAIHSGQDTIHPSSSVGHVVVYVGYNADGTIRIHDPARGVRNISEQELLANAGKAGGNQGYKYQIGFEVTDLMPATRIGGGNAPAEVPQSSQVGGGSALAELQTKNPQYYKWLMQYSQEFGVDPNLAAAIMKAENNLEWGENSHAGAIGAMQLMPDTARGLGVDPYNEQDNIKGGIKYLGQLTKAWNGHAGAIAAAYNSGGGGGTGVKEYYETGDLSKIAYAETRNYVPKVLSYMGGSSSVNIPGQTPLSSSRSPQIQKPLTAKEELDRLNSHMAAVAAGAGKGSGVIASGQLRDGMWVDSKAESLEERRKRVMKRHGLNYTAFRESAKEKEAKAKKRQAEKLNAEIEAKQENLRRQQEELEEQQKAQKKAEKENVGEVQIFGRMKKDKDGHQYSADVMMEEIYRALSSNKWTNDATVMQN